jgi:hypothetical protein
MDFRLRLLIWIPALTYEGVLLTGGRRFASLGQIATLGFLGALLGFFARVYVHDKATPSRETPIEPLDVTWSGGSPRDRQLQSQLA